ELADAGGILCSGRVAVAQVDEQEVVSEAVVLRKPHGLFAGADGGALVGGVAAGGAFVGGVAAGAGGGGAAAGAGGSGAGAGVVVPSGCVAGAGSSIGAAPAAGCVPGCVSGVCSFSSAFFRSRCSRCAFLSNSSSQAPSFALAK